MKEECVDIKGEENIKWMTSKGFTKVRKKSDCSSRLSSYRKYSCDRYSFG